MTKKEIIWNMLKDGQRITPHDISGWCMSLSQRIGQLKKEKIGWLIENNKRIATKLYNGAGYATYWLEDA